MGNWYLPVPFFVMQIDYKKLIVAGSFALGDNRFMVASDLVNEVAKLWALNEAEIDAMKFTDTNKGVNPL